MSFRKAALLLVSVGLAWAYLRSIQGGGLRAHLDQLQAMDRMVAGHRILAPAAFCLIHLAVSFTSFPGCTVLNIFSGYAFGFWKGCALVYPVTLLSAALGFWAGRAFSDRWGRRKEAQLVPRIRAGLAKQGFLFLVSLRLSPLLPFGALNLALGMAGVGFGEYLSSTFVGIFLDVTVLNQIGQNLKETRIAVLDPRQLALEGCALAALVLIFLAKGRLVRTEPGFPAGERI